MKMPTKQILLTVILAGLFAGLTGCYHNEIAFNRRYLLNPLMDPSKTNNLGSAAVLKTFSAHEIGAAAGTGSSSGTCPTCGG
jgi:hypothetical protein